MMEDFPELSNNQLTAIALFAKIGILCCIHFGYGPLDTGYYILIYFMLNEFQYE